jgi:cytochrome c553
MRILESKTNGRTLITIAAIGVIVMVIGMLVTAGQASAGDFERYLERVDQALKTNPNFVAPHALYACQDRRQLAVELYYQGREPRAIRSLKYCFNLLGISEASVAKAPDPVDQKTADAAAAAKMKTQATSEFKKALTLPANINKGLDIYRGCASCHTPEGWGMASGVVPQLAGQHRNVIIKQLADIRAGNRENRVMVPFSSVEAIGGPQAVADVAGYIDTLEISVENGRGSGKDLVLGERLYRENCVRCHGPGGDNEKSIPRIQAQHFGYLVTQFELIRDGKRRNANPEMVAQIKGFEEREVLAVLDYVARLEPPRALQAPPGWRNPDFAQPTAEN